MTPDLWCVVDIALWIVVLAYVGVVPRIRPIGVRWGFGNRHEPAPEMPLWVQRGDRATANHHANVWVFVALVLVARVSGEHDDVTATASMVFVAARIAHSLLYIVG